MRRYELEFAVLAASAIVLAALAGEQALRALAAMIGPLLQALGG